MTDAASPIVAYLILAHRHPPELARLVSALPAESPVFVHFDARASAALYDAATALLRNRPGTWFVPRHVCRWGNIGIVEGTLSLIHGLVAERVRFDRAVLLSGADYPIRSNDEIGRRFAASPQAEYIESFLATAPNRWSDRTGDYAMPHKVLARHLRFRSRVFRVPGLRRMPLDLQPYAGSQWWCLTAEAITHIDAYTARHPEVLRFFRHTFIPDESFIQTVLSNSHLARAITGDDLRFAIWDRPNPPYPAVLGMADLDALQASPKLYARKFDPVHDTTVLDALDRLRAPRAAALDPVK